MVIRNTTLSDDLDIKEFKSRDLSNTKLMLNGSLKYAGLFFYVASKKIVITGDFKGCNPNRTINILLKYSPIRNVIFEDVKNFPVEIIEVLRFNKLFFLDSIPKISQSIYAREFLYTNYSESLHLVYCKCVLWFGKIQGIQNLHISSWIVINGSEPCEKIVKRLKFLVDNNIKSYKPNNKLAVCFHLENEMTISELGILTPKITYSISGNIKFSPKVKKQIKSQNIKVSVDLV